MIAQSALGKTTRPTQTQMAGTAQFALPNPRAEHKAAAYTPSHEDHITPADPQAAYANSTPTKQLRFGIDQGCFGFAPELLLSSSGMVARTYLLSTSFEESICRNNLGAALVPVAYFPLVDIFSRLEATAFHGNKSVCDASWAVCPVTCR